ncbi:MAG: hypothetical protein ACOY82_07940 [Pseudomonadota bacterium]
MTDRRARRLVGTLRIAALALFLLFVAGYVLVDELPWLARAAELGERGLVLGLVAFFFLVLLAFVWQFIADLFHGTNDNVGTVIVALRQPRGVSAVIWLALLLWMTLGLASLAFLPEETLAEWNLQNPFVDMDIEFKAATALFAGIALFLIVAFATRALHNRPWFLLGDLGFVYRPGDVSAGVVRWSEVRDIRTGEVLSAQGRGASALKPALIVSLKHPERYTAGYTPLLRLLIRALTPALRAQTGGGDLYLDPQDFGADYDKVVALMRERSGLAETTR